MAVALNRLWAGSLFGTHLGKLAAELTQSDDKVSGVLRLRDEGSNEIAVFEVAGVFDGVSLRIDGAVPQGQDGEGKPGALEQVRGVARLLPDGQLRGEWTTTQGAGGTFVLFPHPDGTLPTGGPNLLPERLHIASRQVGALRLFAEDVVELIGFMRRDLQNQRVVVTYREQGDEVSRYADDFLRDHTSLGELRYLKLTLQQPEAYGINRLVVVELDAQGVNSVQAQGVEQTWVIGKAEALSRHLKEHQRFLVTSFRKFVFGLSSVLWALALVALPELPLQRRLIFVAVMVIVTLGIVQSHQRFIPNAAIYLASRQPTSLQKAWPQIISWTIAVTSTLVSAVAYGLLKGEIVMP
jgi:hypothetical protein